MKRLTIVTDKPTKHCMFEYVYFANPASVINSRSIYVSRLELGLELAKQLENKGLTRKDFDSIVPVPDTSRIAAQSLSEALGLPVREAIIKNRYMQRTFIIGEYKKRDTVAAQKYLFLQQQIQGKRLLVVDDSIVRGFTSKRIVDRLFELGAKEVHLAISCPPIRYPCYYGVDFPNDQELIAHNRTVVEIKEFLGVTSLTYLDVDNLKRAIGSDTLCDACITGLYPTEFASSIRVQVQNGELRGRYSHYETSETTNGDQTR